MKFNDADLVGIPYRIVVGKRVSDGLVELVERATRQSSDAKLEEIVESVRAKLGAESG